MFCFFVCVRRASLLLVATQLWVFVKTNTAMPLNEKYVVSSNVIFCFVRVLSVIPKHYELVLQLSVFA